MQNISAVKTQENPRTLTILAPKSNIPLDIVFEYISPGMAKSWLRDNIKNNRKPSSRFITGYARTMKDGLWECSNGESIKFNQDGKLVDGQHRLLAIIEANIPVYMMVIYGVTNNAIATLDDGNKRKLRDALTINGIKIKGRITSIEGAIKCLYVLRECFSLDRNYNALRSLHASTTEQMQFLDRMSTFNIVSEKLHNNYSVGAIEKLIPMSVILPMYYLFHDVYPVECDLLMKTLHHGIPASDNGIKCPSFHLLRKISTEKENQRTIRANDYMCLFVWTILQMAAGNKLSKLTYIPTWPFQKEFEGRLKIKQKLISTL